MKSSTVALLLIFVFSLHPARAAEEITTGVQFFDNGQWVAAQQFFESFVQDHPTEAVGFFYLGRTLFEQQQYEQAAQWLEQAVLLDSTNSDYHLWLGRAYGYLAQRASFLWQFPLARKVQAHFEKAVALNPDNLAARADLLEYYLKAPRIIGGGKEKAEVQAHEITKRDFQAGLRAWKMIAQEEAEQYMRAKQDRSPSETLRPTVSE